MDEQQATRREREGGEEEGGGEEEEGRGGTESAVPTTTTSAAAFCRTQLARLAAQSTVELKSTCRFIASAVKLIGVGHACSITYLTLETMRAWAAAAADCI